MKLKCALFACVLGTAIAGCSDHQDTHRETMPSTNQSTGVTAPDVRTTGAGGAAARESNAQTRSTGGVTGTGRLRGS